MTKTPGVSGENPEYRHDRAGVLIIIRRIISVGNIEPFGASEEAFDQTWKALIAEEELVCAQTSNRHDRLPKPQVFIADVRAFPIN